MNIILISEKELTSERNILLQGRRFNHITGVLGSQVGETLRVGLIGGKIGSGIITHIHSDSLKMEITLDSEPPPPFPVTLLIALPRPKTVKKVLLCATSMGVKKIFFMKTWRVEKSFWQSKVLEENSLRELLLLGLEQCGDTIFPEIKFRKRFKPFLEDEVPGIISDSIPVLAHPRTEKRIESLSNISHKNIILAVGPESGYIDYELEMFEKTGFHPVSLGPRILRVEHAVPALLGSISSEIMKN